MRTRLSVAVALSSLVSCSGSTGATAATSANVLEPAREAAAHIQSIDLACEVYVQLAIESARSGHTADARRDFAAAWRLLGGVPVESRRSLLFNILDGYLQCEYYGEALTRVQHLEPRDRAAAMLFVTSGVGTWPASARHNLLNCMKREVEDARTHASMRQAIARVLVDQGLIDEAVRLVTGSLGADAHNRIDDADYLLLELVSRSAQLQNYEGARRLALHASNVGSRDSALVQVVGAAVDHSAEYEAWRTLKDIRPGRSRDLAALRVITMLATRGRLRTATGLLGQVEACDARSRAQVAIGVAYACRGYEQDATRVLQESDTNSQDKHQREHTHQSFAVAFAEGGSIRVAETILAELSNPEGRSSIYQAIAGRYSRLGSSSKARVAYGMAVTSLDPITDPALRATLLRRIAANAIIHRQLGVGRDILIQACQEAIRAAPSSGTGVLELCEIGRLFAKYFGIESSTSAFAAAARSADLYSDAAYVGRLYQHIARSRAEVGDDTGAFNWGIRQNDVLHRAFILIGVAQGLNNAANVSRIESATTTRGLPIRSTWRRPWIIRPIRGRLSSASPPTEFRRTSVTAIAAIQCRTHKMATYYFWDEIEDNVVREYDENNNTIASYTTEPTRYGSVLSQDRGGERRYFQFDGQRSTTELTNSAGDITDTFRYTAFGESITSIGATEPIYRYNGASGYQTCMSSSRYVARMRSVSSLSGRWASPDPLAFAATMCDYRNCVNNPIYYVDPSGATVLIYGWEGFGAAAKVSYTPIKDIYKPISESVLGSKVSFSDRYQKYIYGGIVLAQQAKGILDSAKRPEVDDGCTKCYPRVVLIGYSFGGSTAAKVAAFMHAIDSTVKIDAVFLIDPVFLSWTKGPVPELTAGVSEHLESIEISDPKGMFGYGIIPSPKSISVKPTNWCSWSNYYQAIATDPAFLGDTFGWGNNLIQNENTMLTGPYVGLPAGEGPPAEFGVTRAHVFIPYLKKIQDDWRKLMQSFKDRTLRADYGKCESPCPLE